MHNKRKMERKIYIEKVVQGVQEFKGSRVQEFKGSRVQVVCCCLLMIALMCSCISGDDSTDPSPECAITAFSISDIKSTIHTTGYDGSDSTYTKTLSSSEVTFNIDQINGTITTVDSLPNWVDLAGVVPSITSYGYVYVEKDSIYYYFTSGTDTVDFTTPRNFLVVGTDGVSAKKYKVTFNKSIADADSLLWMEETVTEEKGNFRILARNDSVFCFTENDDTTILFSSVQMFNSKFYATDKEGYLCESSDGVNWSRTSKTVDMLLAADKNYLYAYDGNSIIATSDLVNWTENGNSNMAKLPMRNVSAVAYSTKTNQTLQNVVMVGNAAVPANEKYTYVWYKISSADETNNQKWGYINVSSDNSFGLPVFSQMSNVFNYRGYLYVIGDGYFYRSVDNGISWRKLTTKMLVPDDFVLDLPIQALAIDNYIYLMQSADDTQSGHIWIGRFNGLK